MKRLLLALLVIAPTLVGAQGRYNYFAPGGALSCVSPCTSQTVNLGAGAPIIGVLPNSNLPAIGANPTALVGLTPVNGSASTAIRSDGAPALDQSIVPTWTGIHTFQQSVNFTFTSGGGVESVNIASALPVEQLSNTAAGADAKRWLIDAGQANHLRIYALSDSGGANTFLADITRSGANITDIKWGNSGSNPTTEFQGTGLATFGGHSAYTGTVPVVSACGTTPAIDTHATDTSGTVTVGTVAATSCTVTFATPYATWNHCRITSQSTIASFAYSYTLSAITVSGTSLVADKFDYQCDGS